MRDANRVFSLLHYILKLVVCIGGGEYKLCVDLHLLTLHNWKARNHAAWKAFQHDPSLFSEELGESNLSILARRACTDPNRFKINHVNKYLHMITLQRDLRHFIKPNLESQSKWRTHVKPTGVEVKSTTAFLRSIIADAKTEAGIIEYTGDLKVCNSSVEMKTRVRPCTLDVVIPDDASNLIRENHTRTERLTVVRWLQQQDNLVARGVVTPMTEEPAVFARMLPGDYTASSSSGDSDNNSSSDEPLAPRPRQRRRIGSSGSEGDVSDYQDLRAARPPAPQARHLAPQRSRSQRRTQSIPWQVRFHEDISCHDTTDESTDPSSMDSDT